MTRTSCGLGLLIALAILVLAGCGGGASTEEGTESSGTGTTQAPAESEGASPETGQVVLTGASVSGLGTVLVNSEGLTVYEFGKDQGTTSSCYGTCEAAWPPVISKGPPSAGEGASSSQLGTSKRKDGSLQVTYAGHPLYTFSEDEGPGEANGNGISEFGGEWSALEESGSAAEGGGAETESGGAGGYSGY